jgi:eukaryotic-like serine/threonine-protein kinase
MEFDRWELIERLYFAALEREPGDRDAFLDEACAGDEDLRREVAGLLAYDVPDDSFIRPPAIENAARALAAQPFIETSTDPTGSLVAGSQIGVYRLLEPLGRGGMGEVHLALDTRLGRKVAVKLLPAEFTTDAGRVRRFAREARAASALNHPNIITIHEIGEVRTEAGDTHYIVTEFVEGETLRQRMTNAPQGRLSPAEALDVAAQIAAALATAHEAGIAHRDIKPENVMMRRDGIVKVLDFGLAKLTEVRQGDRETGRQGDDPLVSLSPSLSSIGAVMGTPRYMSPEQARGESVDARTDIFSLGVMLYEMVAGRPPFAGAAPNETIAAILRDSPPPLAECAPDAPPEMERILTRALRKNREERYQSVSEMLADLQRLKSHLEQSAYVALSRSSGERPEHPAPSGVQTSAQPGPPPAIHKIASFPSKVFSSLRHSRRARAISGVALAVLLTGVWMIRYWWEPSPYSPSPQAKRFYDKGLNDLRDGAYYAASKAFEVAINAGGEQAIPHARLAEAWMEMDYSDKANYDLRRASMLKPARMASVDTRYIEALNRTIDHNFAAAIESYRAILEQTPEDEKAYAYLDLGRAYERNEEIDEATNHYKQAKQRDPNYAAAPLRLGLIYSRRQEYDKAAAEFAEAGKRYEALTNAEGLNEVRYQQGVLAGRLGRFDEAKYTLQKAHDKAQDAKNLPQQIAALLQLSLTFYAEGKTVPARERAQKALDLASENYLENLKAQGLVDLGNALYLRREYEEAETHFNSALKFAGDAKGRRIEALARLSLGKLYVQRHIKMDDAARHLELALAFFQKGGYHKETSETISLIGRAKLQQGDYAAALRIFDEQVQRASQVNDRQLLARLHALIGRTLADQDVYPEALRHFEESYSIYHSLGDQHLYMAYGLLDRSDMLWRLGRYVDARGWLNQAPSVAKQVDSEYKGILLARMRLTNAAMLLSERRFSEAITECQLTLDVADAPVQYTATAAKYMLGLAMVFYNKDSRAKLLCEEAVGAAIKIGDQILIWNARLALAQVMMEIGNPAEALTAALQAYDKFEHANKLESQWRAACLVARASRRTNNHSSARKYAAQAQKLLSSLRQRWTVEAFKSYLARPDIDHYRKQLQTVSTLYKPKETGDGVRQQSFREHITP